MEYQLNFPKTLQEFKDFTEEKLLNIEEINDQICSSIIDKMNNCNYSFSKEELELMIRLTTLGDVCCCDSDHRIDADAKVFIISET